MLKALTSVILLAFLTNASHALTHSTSAESNEWMAVTHIKSEAPDSTGDTTPAYCNGTLIAKKVMVTAAHCVLLAYVSKDHLINIQTGYYKFITRPDGQVVKIGYVAKNNFSKQVNIELPASLADKIASRGEKASIGPGEDFAVLWWNESTPETEEIAVIEAVTPSEHTQIIRSIASYPLNVVSINPFTEMSTDTKRMGTLNAYKWSKGYVHSKGNVRVEQGDSGAPLFVKINGRLKVFAVVKGKASTVFDNWDVYPAVNSHLCGINERMPLEMRIRSCQE